MRIRFYTYAPVAYDYILRNVKQKPLACKHEIVDIGVYELLKGDHEYSQKTLDKFVNCKTSGWKVVPDYPDIFKENSIEMDINNVARSKDLMLKYYDPVDKSHMPVIQGHYNDPHSFDEYSRWFKEEYMSGPIVIGIGTVCKLSNKDNLLRTLFITRKQFPEAWIHAFGLSIRYLREARGLINSFDSTSFTFPRTSGRPSAKNKAMRIEYFYEYLALYNKYTVEYDKIDNVW